jgi:hypothetical protein
MIEIPTVTFGGDATALLFENRPGSDLEVLAHARYEDNPRAFLDLVLDKLDTHYPITARRVNAAREAFDRHGVTASLDDIARAAGVGPVRLLSVGLRPRSLGGRGAGVGVAIVRGVVCGAGRA